MGDSNNARNYFFDSSGRFSITILDIILVTSPWYGNSSTLVLEPWGIEKVLPKFAYV